jgi:hypothetical protein
MFNGKWTFWYDMFQKLDTPFAQPRSKIYQLCFQKDLMHYQPLCQALLTFFHLIPFSPEQNCLLLWLLLTLTCSVTPVVLIFPAWGLSPQSIHGDLGMFLICSPVSSKPSILMATPMTIGAWLSLLTDTWSCCLGHVCLFVWGDWVLNSELHPCKAGALQLESHLQSIFLWLFWWWGLTSYFPRLALNRNPPDLSLPSC